MATQGMVSVTDGGRVVLKAVAGCNGMAAESLARIVGSRPGPLSPEGLHGLAISCGFGCQDCLVVQSGDRFLAPEDFEPTALWSGHFADPHFNPRWERGTADHVHVVEIREG